jgi:hypothetical protein
MGRVSPRHPSRTSANALYITARSARSSSPAIISPQIFSATACPHDCTVTSLDANPDNGRGRMTTDDLTSTADDETAVAIESGRGNAGFIAGVLFGAFLGAGIALLFAPERGDKTRGRLRKRVQSLSEGAREGIDRAGSRTRKELRRRERRIRAELARARARAERALE